MDALGVIRDNSSSKKDGADAAASKLLRNIVKSLTEDKKSNKLSILRALFNFFDRDNSGMKKMTKRGSIIVVVCFLLFHFFS